MKLQAGRGIVRRSARRSSHGTPNYPKSTIRRIAPPLPVPLLPQREWELAELAEAGSRLFHMTTTAIISLPGSASSDRIPQRLSLRASTGMT
jgi:hypothetical protein